MKRVLFVCTGNTCRSPLAEYILKLKTAGAWEVKSAGVAAYPGNGASNHVVSLLKERDVDVKHKAQLVTPELITWADIVLTMTGVHRQMLQEAFPEYADRIDTIKHFVTGRHEDVIDPYGGSEAAYRATHEELEGLIERLIEKENQAAE